MAGTDLIKSLILLSNKAKDECEIPDFVQLSNITSIYKNRGSKSDLDSDRGVFNVATVRSIIDKLVYNDYYDLVDMNMSDSNVGGRRGRNIRDNLFIINGVINYALKEKIAIDINLYDIAKCFDAMWYQETMNDMWDVGVKDNKFALMAKMNKECNIAVKTPAGITERFVVNEIEMQGTVSGPLKACVQVDTLGRDCYTYSEGLFLYKDCVAVPPLSMCDDIASISRCGIESIKNNAIINAKIESKKLEFGPKKCYNIHIGENADNCCSLKVHNSTMKKTDSEVYLGEIISSSGSNEKNIANKSNQGVGAVSQIFSSLSQISLGHYYYDIAFIMRDSILVSKLVSSSEIWYNVTKQEYQKLENIDEMFFRRLLNVPVSVPKEGIYLEVGKISVKYIIKMRRMMYWWHLVNIDHSELLHKFYLAQSIDRSKDDWIYQLEQDKTDLNLQLSDAEIGSYTKEQFRRIVKCRTEAFAASQLEKVKKSHSKTEKLKFCGFKPREYFLSKNLTTEEVQNLFKLRTRMINVKANFKSSHTNNMWCRLCLLFTETQQHLLECPVIRLKTKHLINFKDISYDMIFGNTGNQEIIAKKYQIILKARDDILESDE